MRRPIVHLLLVLGLFSAVCRGGAAPPERPIDRFEKAIVAYEAKDRTSPPPQGAVLFVGSSTFALWKGLEEDMKPIVVINRGFGGSTIPEVLHYLDRIVIPYKPAKIVLYVGGNDIADGVEPIMVFERFKTLVQKIRAALPETAIYFISMKSAPTRLRFSAQYDEANRLIHEYIQKGRNLHFIETRHLLVDGQGKPREELYLDDRLHLNRQGYEAWIPVLKAAIGEAPAQK